MQGPLSSQNARVTYARRLARRAFRRSERCFLVEGPQAVREADLSELFATDEALDRYADLAAEAVTRGTRVFLLTEPVLASIAQTVTPQGLVGIAPFRDLPLEELPQGRLVAVLSGVRDPGNAGTILRVADAAGADAVVFADESVDPYNPKCVRASAGSLFHVPFATGVPLAETAAALRARGLRILAADAAGATDIGDADLSGPHAWVFGSEAHGLGEAARDAADAVVRVPIYGQAESLNLATAAAVCLYASAGALRRPGGGGS